jgi:hypothetical protein
MIITPSDIQAELDKINITIRLYGAPMEVGFLTQDIRASVKTFSPLWKNHDNCSIYMMCRWTRFGVEWETFDTVEEVRKRALGIINSGTYFKEQEDSHF